MRAPASRSRSRRRGTTLVELLVAAALVAVVLALLWSEWSASRREAEHAGEHETLLTSATLLEELLQRDLRAGLPLVMLPEEERPGGEATTRIVFPRFAGYEGAGDPALRYRRVEYVWDAEAGTLRRNQEVLPLWGLERVEFRWVRDLPGSLEVRLGPPEMPGRCVTFRVAAPPGTDSPAIWRAAPWHRGAVPG